MRRQTKLTALAKLAVLLLVALALGGFLWHGFSAEINRRIWQDIADRPGGPMTFRFVLQPLMAAIAAWLDGAADARLGRPGYFWTLVTDSTRRGRRLIEGLNATARIILLGVGMDAIYQLTVLDTFYPGEMALIAVLLCFLPYVLLRGFFARVVQAWTGRR